MQALELIGQAAVAYLTRAIGTEEPGDGTQRFLLDRLTGPQVAAICRDILAQPALAAAIRIRIPRDVGESNGLPADILTDERTTHWRHAACDRPVLLIANTDDDQGQSLRDVTPVGSSELLGEPALWVVAAGQGLGLTDQQLAVFEKALKGLQDAKPVSLETFAAYDRLRVADIEGRREELLTTHGLHITNVLAEPGQVVVSVARPQRQVVSLIDVWRNRTLNSSRERSNQMLVVGVREANGETLYLCPENPHAPHTLVAGTTGSGKSVLIQNLLLDIAITNDCANARIILIDPKQGADYLDLRPLRHIHGGIITTPEQSRLALESVVDEMDRRYSLFRAAGVANLVRYNTQVPPEQRLPRIWLIHDEFAVWMLTDDYKDMVANIVARLGVMARAAGIFLIFAAQRPEDRVMPLQLRDNLGNRLVLRVESPGTSKIAIGEEGAERLLGKGHLAARLPSEDRIILAQVPILTPEQIQTIVAAIG